MSGGVEFFAKSEARGGYIKKRVQGDPKLCLPLPGRNGAGPSKTD